MQAQEDKWTYVKPLVTHYKLPAQVMYHVRLFVQFAPSWCPDVVIMVESQGH